LGLRSAKYLQDIAKIPGVLMVDPFQNTSKLLEYVDITYTVSGTIGIEASIVGKKSVSLSPMFYNVLPNSLFDDNPFNIVKHLEEVEKIDNEELNRSFYTYIQYTHKGFISDPVSLPYCISSENIEDVSKAFIKLLSIL
jgi:capsule polysaccharide export protein KpsC/LpsZ